MITISAVYKNKLFGVQITMFIMFIRTEYDWHHNIYINCILIIFSITMCFKYWIGENISAHLNKKTYY